MQSEQEKRDHASLAVQSAITAFMVLNPNAHITWSHAKRPEVGDAGIELSGDDGRKLFVSYEHASEELFVRLLRKHFSGDAKLDKMPGGNAPVVSGAIDATLLDSKGTLSFRATDEQFMDAADMSGRIGKAMALAMAAHRGQKDLSGVDYILHVIDVYSSVRRAHGSEDMQVAALLHDVVEDTDVPLSTIEAHFGKKVARIVDALTKREGESYHGDFCDRVVANREACQIKVHDVMDNMRRLSGIADVATRERLTKKYSIMLTKLDHALRDVP